MYGFPISHKNKEFYFYDKELREKMDYAINDNVIEIIPEIFVSIDGISFNDIFDVFNIDKNKIDFAYPEQLRNTDKAFDLRIHNGDQPFWYYGIDQTFGAPLWKSDIMIRFKEEMKKVFYKHVMKTCNTYEV